MTIEIWSAANMDQAFGMQLRTVREERGWSREELAERLGAGNAKTVWKWETGAADPRVTTVRRLATALNVEAAELLEERQT
jgi:transcriptional regulator with XRE-family HTH domain